MIGLGGIGSPVAQALAQFLGADPSLDSTLFLIDGDVFEERNRSRVLFERGGNKAVAKAAELSARCGSGVALVPIPMYVTPYNLRTLIHERDLVFLAVDNHATRRSVSNRCRKLRDVMLISGGNDGIDDRHDGTFGNVMVYERRDGRDLTNPLSRFHPEIASPQDKRPDEIGCAALAKSAPQLLFTNLAVAAAMLAAFHGWLTERLDYEEVFLDIGLARMQTVKRSLRHDRTDV
jgi:hypothetical protein